MVQQKVEIAIKRAIAIVFALIVPLLIVCGPAYAASGTCVTGTESTCSYNGSGGSCSISGTIDNKNVNVPINHCTDPAVSDNTCTNPSDTSKCNFITQYIQPFINFLSALVGVAVTISIVIGGIQYGSSAGDSAKVTAAKNRIRNSIIALLAYIFLYAMLNFLVPGGLV